MIKFSTKKYFKLLAQKKYLLLLNIFGISLIATVTYFSLAQKKDETQLQISQTPTVLAAESQELNIDEKKSEELKTLNILLLGYGGFGHQGGTLADVIQIAQINFETSTINLISIPRDLWVKNHNNQETKINSAISLTALNKDLEQETLKNNSKAIKDLVSNITGIPINYYVAIEFVSFQRAIGEELGGIDVQVAETLDDPWYPISGQELNTCGLSAEEVAQLTAQYSGFELEKQFPCRYEHLLYKSGLVHMEGGDALKFVRSRHGSSSGDFSRSKRQHAILIAIKNKLFALDALDDAPKFFKEINTHLHTDLDVEIIKYLVPALKNSKDYQNKSIILDTNNTLQSSKSSNGQFILIPKQGINNWQGVQTYLKQELK